MSFTRKITLVTGASSGIGRAVAARLAHEGHHAVAAARRLDRLNELAAEVRAKAEVTGTIEPRQLDVTDRHAVRSLVSDVVNAQGRLDIANAGVMPLSRLDAGLVDEWDRMIDVNVRGLLHTIAAVQPVFTQQGHGHFLTTASIGAHQVNPTAAVYCGTKYAAWAITEGLRLESSPGVRVTTISPGVVTSELATTISDPATQDLMAQYRRHAIPPEAIADAVIYATSADPSVDVNEIIVRPVQQR